MTGLPDVDAKRVPKMGTRGDYTDGFLRTKRWAHDDAPRTMAISMFEGDNWIPFVPGMARPECVHAILFEDGSVWDACNGWRRKEMP